MNGTLDSLPDIPPPPTEEERARAPPRLAWRDSLRAMPRAARDSARAARADEMGEVTFSVGGGRDSTRRRPSVCDTATVRTRVSSRFDGGLSVVTRTPCDEDALVNSPSLPPSIFDEGDTAFDARMEQALRDAALSLGAQAQWSPRADREVGLGAGCCATPHRGALAAVRVDAALGRGYSARLQARIGTADLRRTPSCSCSHGG